MTKTRGDDDNNDDGDCDGDDDDSDDDDDDAGDNYGTNGEADELRRYIMEGRGTTGPTSNEATHPTRAH